MNRINPEMLDKKLLIAIKIDKRSIQCPFKHREEYDSINNFAFKYFPPFSVYQS